ncbi:MAG: hypothetical protein Q9215_006361 [Flavoplaca cf. flavocitrina]
MSVSDEARGQHDKIVEEIRTSIKQFYGRGEKFRIRHGSTNSTRQTATKGQNFVDTGSLSNILQVNKVQKTCLVEPNVPMDQLVKSTLAYGLVPLVAMEFPGITVGGGFSGTSAESSSFKYGVFDRNINYIEMILANGDVAHCSEDKNPDLFHGAAGAMGTLGVVTLLEVQLMPATSYVHISYHPVTGVADAIGTLEALTEDTSIDYLDGILFSKNQGAIIVGRLSNECAEDGKMPTFSKAKDPWFYLHVQDRISKTPNGTSTETILLAEYLFRYDRGAFWAARWAFDYFMTPFNSVTRGVLDGLMHTRVLYKAQDASSFSATQYIAQDLAVPFPQVGELIDYSTKVCNIWPLWLCPLKPTPHPTINPFPASGHGASEMLLNVGIWGPAPTKRRDEFVEINRGFEEKLRTLSGMKALYAHTFYTEDEFWRVYDREWYDALREKYGAGSLPSVYDKVKGGAVARKTMKDRVRDVRPIGGAHGLIKAMRYRYSSDYRRIIRDSPV